ncbi:MAG: hypothetical protein IKH41_05050 [Clostridia bacterium]|nr:hypothetical protein [Clostridia bacterium]
MTHFIRLRRSMSLTILKVLAIALTVVVLTVMAGCGRSSGNPSGTETSTHAPVTLASFLEKYRARGFETMIDAAPEFIADLLSVRETAKQKDFDDLSLNNYDFREKVLFSRPITVCASCYSYSFTLWIRFEVYGAQNFEIGRALALELFAQLDNCREGSVNGLDGNIRTAEDFVAAFDGSDVNTFSLYWSEVSLDVDTESISLQLSRG